MDKATLELFRTKLEGIRFTIIGVVGDTYETINEDSSQQMADISDHAAQSYNKELGIGLKEQESKKLRLVEEAIKRMEDGQYGVCSECSEPIPEARLQIIPFASHCIGCLEASENKGGQVKL